MVRVVHYNLLPPSGPLEEEALLPDPVSGCMFTHEIILSHRISCHHHCNYPYRLLSIHSGITSLNLIVIRKSSENSAGIKGKFPPRR